MAYDNLPPPTDNSDAQIATLRNRMSEDDFERERARLREIYGNSSAEAAAKRDQAMADLFWRSGWTQEELAAKEGQAQSWVSYRLRFGRFLNFITTVINLETLPNTLSERQFRQYWNQTDKKLDERYIRRKGFGSRWNSGEADYWGRPAGRLLSPGKHR